MRGVNLNVFKFDYDVTWYGFFLSADEHIYGRFGGRDATSADTYLTLPALKKAMRAALEQHRSSPPLVKEGQGESKRTVEDYAAIKRLKPNACIHCHQVYDFQRDEMRTQGTWKLDLAWVYPLPENIGVVVKAEDGTTIRAVSPKSPADVAGIQPGDRLRKINDARVNSFADVSHALHAAGPAKTMNVSVARGEKEVKATLQLPEGWRKTDISWRESMWGLEPNASVYGKDLTTKEKKRLGLPENSLAFSQGNFVPPAAAKAGIRAGDIIFGLDNKNTAGMTMLQFNVFIRLNYKVGDRVTYHVVRNGQRLEIPIVLPKRAW